MVGELPVRHNVVSACVIEIANQDTMRRSIREPSYSILQSSHIQTQRHREQLKAVDGAAGHTLVYGPSSGPSFARIAVTMELSLAPLSFVDFENYV